MNSGVPWSRLADSWPGQSLRDSSPAVYPLGHAVSSPRVPRRGRSTSLAVSPVSIHAARHVPFYLIRPAEAVRLQSQGACWQTRGTTEAAAGGSPGRDIPHPQSPGGGTFFPALIRGWGWVARTRRQLREDHQGEIYRTHKALEAVRSFPRLLGVGGGWLGREASCGKITRARYTAPTKPWRRYVQHGVHNANFLQPTGLGNQCTSAIRERAVVFLGGYGGEGGEGTREGLRAYFPRLLGREARTFPSTIRALGLMEVTAVSRQRSHPPLETGSWL